MAPAILFFVRRTCVWRMVQHDEYEINIPRHCVQHLRQPLSLGPGSLVERTVEYQHQAVSCANRVVAAVLKVRKTLKIIRQSDVLVAMEIVIAQRRVNGDLFLTPNAGLAIPD